jgi:hypothetical protein
MKRKKRKRKMYKVSYYLASSAVRFKAFETLTEATKFANQQSIDSVIEIKYYENCTDNGSTLRS